MEFKSINDAKIVARAYVAISCSAVVMFCVGCGATPQLGSEECLGAADALWAAVAAKNSDLLEKSATKIEKLHSATKLSDAAFEELTDIIATARTGDWPSARGALKKFVQGQRPIERRS